MLYFEHWRQSKKLPKIGDIIYLIPIRYWEPDDYEPDTFTVEKASIQDDGRLCLYGQYEKDEPDHPMYAAKDFDACWYWSYKSARKVQLLLCEINDILSLDDTSHLIAKLRDEGVIP